MELFRQCGDFLLGRIVPAVWCILFGGIVAAVRCFLLGGIVPAM